MPRKIILSSKLFQYAWRDHNHNIWHYCPACKVLHPIPVYKKCPTAGRAWFYNKNPDNPTFKPGIKYQTEIPFNPGATRRCHYIIVDGKITYYRDSDHELAGQTVDLPDLPISALDQRL